MMEVEVQGPEVIRNRQAARAAAKYDKYKVGHQEP